MGGRPRKEVEFDVLISGYAPAYSHTVREYLALLELPMPADESKDIVLPLMPFFTFILRIWNTRHTHWVKRIYNQMKTRSL